MICRNTAGTGHWCVRADGSVFAFGGAPYLGPLPKYLTEWNIGGTTTSPIVGIADDGLGGFVLEADPNPGNPGLPALYRIPSTGVYAS